jgi:hypothetical protein
MDGYRLLDESAEPARRARNVNGRRVSRFAFRFPMRDIAADRILIVRGETLQLTPWKLASTTYAISSSEAAS